VTCEAQGLRFTRCMILAIEKAGNELVNERIGCSGYVEFSSASKSWMCSGKLSLMLCQTAATSSTD
jgi:hypothetical protein